MKMGRSNKSCFRQIDACRALKAALAAGLVPQSYRISPEGEIIVNLSAEGDGFQNSFDQLINRNSPR